MGIRRSQRAARTVALLGPLIIPGLVCCSRLPTTPAAADPPANPTATRSDWAMYGRDVSRTG